ncbi:putative bifunctional diguanylate cyclase/phosphodiesterase [Paenalcaligenes suwonensis]|uniref:putative bifunctional diguanylate cyclase/phosphodiesterase n=1 Tax=Paenalcaligenes suwonensis TaxID=1202713 RepID=UPI0014078E6F|nr:EAL domain-containing protein [Paenalcaligenes suwonensis]NHC61524.1 EAL domain-containing protein [Paenalcaligenes suwonensis]
MAALLVVSTILLLLQHRTLRWAKTESNSNLQLKSILDNIDALITIKDANLQYLHVNKKACDFFNINAVDALGKRFDDIYASTQEQAKNRKSDLQVLLHGDHLSMEEQFINAHDKRINTFLSLKFPLRDKHERITAVCSISTDITAYKAIRDINHQLIFYDLLTELPNRRLLLNRLENLLLTARRDQQNSAILFIDLDSFKHINDARGHHIGDELLKKVARRLLRMMRQDDSVARIGSDEFVVVLTQLSSDTDTCYATAEEVSSRIRRALEVPYFINGQAYLLSASIGAAFLTAQSVDTEEALREANVAMHRAKDNGRNQVMFYQPTMTQEAEDRVSIGRDLSYAIGSDQLKAYVQPQFDMQGQTVGVELLLRWNHPERGWITPERFIPLAEESQLISKLGDWLLEQACALLLAYPTHCFTVSVNISPSQFRDPSLLQRIEHILDTHHTPAHRLIFEITEGMLMQDPYQTTALMNRLVQRGIRFAIDDFGTGYSNLAALKRLPLYELKIDRSLIHDVDTDPDSAAIVRAVLALGQQLRLHIVAEGVETQAQADFLNQHHCSALQGHLYAEAMPQEQWRQQVERRIH